MFTVPIFSGRKSYCLYGAALCALAATQAQAVVTVSLVPQSTSIVLGGAGDPLVVDVTIDNPDGVQIRSWSLDLSFDPAVFEPLPAMGSVPAAGFELGGYVPAVGGALLPQWNDNYENNGVAPDVARAGLLNTGSGTGTAAAGLLAKIALDATSLSPGSQLSLTGQLLMPGSVPVTDVVFVPAVITVVPEPVAPMLFALASMFLMRFLRARSRRCFCPVTVRRMSH